uniref:Uncharacterized protein n=1 Tax=Anguilla anguilla TaxID=7936 RepID=A0A0E9RKR6_ANGAN
MKRELAYREEMVQQLQMEGKASAFSSAVRLVLLDSLYR